MQDQINGHDLSEEEENAVRDIQRIQAREPVTVVEAVPETPPFEQEAHNLMLLSVDQLSQHWRNELQRASANATVMQEAVMQTCDRIKGELTRLHLLGALVRQEVKRGEDVCSHVDQQLEQMLEQRVA
jgi:gamma-glutamylcysteine synthetase